MLLEPWWTETKKTPYFIKRIVQVKPYFVNILLLLYYVLLATSRCMTLARQIIIICNMPRHAQQVISTHILLYL